MSRPLRPHQQFQTRKTIVLLDNDVRSHITCEVYEDTDHRCFYCVSRGIVETNREETLE